jgi:hypothetical protein
MAVMVNDSSQAAMPSSSQQAIASGPEDAFEDAREHRGQQRQRVA